LRVVKIPQGTSFLQLLIVLGVMAVVIGIATPCMDNTHLLAGIIEIIIGLFFFAGFFVFRKIFKPEYGLFLFTIGREQQVLTCDKLNDIRALESALHQAIAMRG
jgi:Family of unknown function (DUF6232)